MRQVGDIVHVQGFPRPFVKVGARYNCQDKEKRTKCPLCRGLGVPWGGWFHCENCELIAVVATGESFLPVNIIEEKGEANVETGF